MGFLHLLVHVYLISMPAVSSPEFAAAPPSVLSFRKFLTATPASELATALLQLPVAERLLLSLIYFHDLPMTDAASAMRLDAENAFEIYTSAVSSLEKIVAQRN